MNIPQIITAMAAFLAILWTLVQIVAYAREKDPKNIKIAMVLTILIIITAFFYPLLKDKLPPKLRAISSPGAGRTTGGHSTMPPVSPSLENTALMTVTPPEAVHVTSPSPVAPSATPESSPTPDQSPSTSPMADPGNLPDVRKGELRSSFIIDIRRTMLGGVGGVGARCTFAETGGADTEIIAYSLTVHYLDTPGESEDKAITRSFERTLRERIAVGSGSTVEKNLEFDNEIGDLVLKSKKSGRTGWIRISWSGKDKAGNTVSTESVANKPE